MQSPLSGLIYHTRGNRDRLGCGSRLIARTISWGSRVARETDSLGAVTCAMYVFNDFFDSPGRIDDYMRIVDESIRAYGSSSLIAVRICPRSMVGGWCAQNLIRGRWVHASSWVFGAPLLHRDQIQTPFALDFCRSLTAKGTP